MIKNIAEYYDELEQTEKNSGIIWDELEGKRLLVTGASGMIGSYIIDLLMCHNRHSNKLIEIYALSRSRKRIDYRFKHTEYVETLNIVEHDICKPLNIEVDVDYIIHAASNTHPLQYSTDPIGTIMTNIEGTKNVLEFARKCDAKRVVFTSSVEVYGENRGNTEYFDEKYFGYIDCNTLRAGYPEGKRAGEALCQGFRNQYGMDIVIPRLSRTYGPTMSKGDSKAIAQFINKGIVGEDIVLKSEGNQLYSYSYAADAVTGILYVMLKGNDGEAYNIADEGSDITLKEMASLIAESVGTKVIFDLPDEVERAGYSTATKALLDNKKIKTLGWSAGYDIKRGMERTLKILKDVNQSKQNK